MNSETILTKPGY